MAPRLRAPVLGTFQTSDSDAIVDQLIGNTKIYKAFQFASTQNTHYVKQIIITYKFRVNKLGPEYDIIMIHDFIYKKNGEISHSVLHNEVTLKATTINIKLLTI